MDWRRRSWWSVVFFWQVLCLALLLGDDSSNPHFLRCKEAEVASLKSCARRMGSGNGCCARVWFY